MKLNHLDAHDRYENFIQQSFDISECCQDLLNKRPFGDIPFYAFAHARTEEDGVTKRLVWQPRLTKPQAQENSMLFKLYQPDIVKVIWMIPAKELWANFERGKMTQNQLIWESIVKFRSDKKKLEAKEDDDLTDEQAAKVYEAISMHAKIKRKYDRI